MIIEPVFEFHSEINERYIERENGSERERERERNSNELSSK